MSLVISNSSLSGLIAFCVVPESVIQMAVSTLNPCSLMIFSGKFADVKRQCCSWNESKRETIL
jgi:hypothetical protein